jgi:hypothetical protein
LDEFIHLEVDTDLYDADYYFVMLSEAQRSRSISIGELTLGASNEAIEMLRLRCASLSMTAGAS